MTQATETQTITGTDVRFSIQVKPNCIVAFDIEAFPSLVEKAYKMAVKTVAKEVSLPGFRKGKAPDDMVAKKFPKDIDQKWQQNIANLAFQQCSPLSKVPVLQGDNKMTFNMKSHDLKKGAHLVLEFESEPEVPAIDPKLINIKPVKRPEVSPEKVKETIRQVQLFFATWNPITDRPIREGDFVLLDVDVIEDTPHTALFQNTRFEVSDKSMAKWMQEVIVGQKSGDSVEGISRPDEDVPEDEKAQFQPKRTRIMIKAVQEAEVPELDEPFIQKLGVQSMEEMERNIESTLNKQADGHVAEKQREQVTEQLFEKFPFDLPKTLVEKEARFRMNQLLNDEQFTKDWQNLSSDERRKMIESIFSFAEKAVRLFYLCRKILKDAQINISPKDIHNRPTNALDILMDPQQMLRSGQSSETQQAETFSKLILEKAQDYLVTNASQDNG